MQTAAVDDEVFGALDELCSNDVSAGIERKTLRTLQMCADDFCLTRSGDQPKNKSGKEDGILKMVAPKKPLSVFEDPSLDRENKFSVLPDNTEAPCTCQCHAKSEEQLMYNLMTAEPSLEEWKKLAEERRQALEETLAENRQLHFEVLDLKNEVKSLNSQVRQVKEERDYFASVLQNALSDDNEEDATSSLIATPVKAELFFSSDGTGSP